MREIMESRLQLDSFEHEMYKSCHTKHRSVEEFGEASNAFQKVSWQHLMVAGLRTDINFKAVLSAVALFKYTSDLLSSNEHMLNIECWKRTDGTL